MADTRVEIPKCKQCAEYEKYLDRLDKLLGVSPSSSRPRDCFIRDLQNRVCSLEAQLREKEQQLSDNELAFNHANEVVGKLKAQLTEARSRLEAAQKANELDRRSLWAVVRSIDEEITGRMWLIEGRGSYEWDDDKYRQEFGWAIHALQEKLEPLRKIAHDLLNCPDTDKGVDSVRKLEAENDRLRSQLEAATRPVTELLEAMETCHICKGAILVDDGPVHCEDCSSCCDEHEEPECRTIYDLHRAAKLAMLASHTSPAKEQTK